MSAGSLRELDDAQGGCKHALKKLLATWRHRFRAAASCQLKPVQSRVDTSDVVQESLIQAWRKVKRFKPNSEAEFRSWAGKVAKGHLANTRRFHHAARRDARLNAGPAHLAACPDEQHRPTIDSDELELLRQAFSSLETRLRVVIQKRYFEDATFTEIAKALNCSAAGARLLCERAISKLRQSMGVPPAGTPHDTST
ncbi:MAG: sigma-70 family RNA polymerase sigma factor [Planctomycetaceae bacterium]